QGISLDSRVIAGGLQNVLSRLTGPQKSVLSLKATWEAYDKEDSEDIMQIIAREAQFIDSKDEVGSTPLSLAVENGNTAIAAVLLDHGADMAGDEYGSNMLHIAAQTGNKEMVEMLLAGGADVTAEDEYGSSTLHVAVRSGNLEMVGLLLSKGADISATEEDGSSALHVAVSSGNPKMIELLLDNGANIEAVEEDGRTALHVAACYKNTQVVKVLLSKGANVAAVNQAGRTPLHFAACYSNTNMITLLLNQGARIEACDNGGNNPLSHMIAAQQQDLDDEGIAIAHFLCSQGSEPKTPASSQRSSLKKHQVGLLTITEHWHKCYLEGKPLMLIPSEVIKGGEAAVTTYLKALNETAAAQLTKRCKICVVGPSTWGKTTLVKSLSEAAPSLVDEEDRTIGIDLFSLTFPPEDKVSIEADRVHDGNSRYDVTFWDFAGQDIYETTHVMFFSNRTLYLVCIHLQVYAEKLRKMATLSRLEGEKFMQRFFEATVL
ncbi:hypothetical protein JG688_00017608, partial [Phytophthora aleatoria]